MTQLIIAACLLLKTAAFDPTPTDEVIDNPHRGYMLWGSTALADGGLPNNFHEANLYHVYLPWRMIETSDQVFDWADIEQTYITPIINDHPEATLVLRLVADYPDGPSSGLSAHYSGGDNHRDYPLFLEQDPLNIGRNVYNSCNGDGPGVAPDWNSPEFSAQATELVNAFSTYFDGDPRITAIQVGLLGLWGEWHQSGCTALEPNNAIKNSIKTAYDLSFSMTPLQTRYARNPDVTNVDFGFHEDYFPSFTTNCNYGFPQCDDTGDWNLEFGLTNTVPAARNNWLDNPISGESPLTSQQNTWINDEADVSTVLNDYHFSFLGPAGKHESFGNDDILNRIANQLGYRIQLDQVTIDSPITTAKTSVSMTLTNVGSAPIYHPYQLALDLVDDSEQTIDTWLFDDPLRDWLPNISTLTTQNFPSPPDGNYSLRAYGKSVIPSGRNLILANANRDAANRVIIGDVMTNHSDLIFADSFE